MNEEEFINQFARKWNYKLLKHTRRVLIGWFNIEHMFKIFLRAYNWRKQKENKILITGCGSCLMYGFEEGFYHHCNYYDKSFEITEITPGKSERPEFCNVKKIIIMEETK